MKKMVGFFFFLSSCLSPASADTRVRVAYSYEDVEIFCSCLDTFFKTSMVIEQRELIHSLFRWLPEMIKQVDELAGKQVVKQELFCMGQVVEAFGHLITYFDDYGIDLEPYNHLDGNLYFWFMAKDMIVKMASKISWTPTHVFALQVFFIARNQYFIDDRVQKIFVSEVEKDLAGKVLFRHSLYFFNQVPGFLNIIPDEELFVLGGEPAPLGSSLPLRRSLLHSFPLRESYGSVSPPLSDAGSLASSASSSPMSAFQMLRESRVSPQEWKK